jgi:alpha-ribazole phosphatase
MHRLTLIRHALTDWNVSGRFQGQTDVALSEEGREQARRLARHVRGLERGAVVYASPLVRARETAEIAFPRREIRLDPRLSELDFGAFEGSTQEENERHEAWAWWIADPYPRPAPGGESYRQLRERAVAWMEELSRAGSGPDHVVAVSHSGTIQMLLAHVLGVERPRWRKRIYLRHTGISRVLFRGSEAVVERVNDTRHLAAEGADPFLD